MKDVSIKINPISFPNLFASDKEKETYEYGLRIGQSIQYEWFRKDSNGCKFYDQRSNFHRLRLYARGEQSVGKYKNELSVDGDLSHLIAVEDLMKKIRSDEIDEFIKEMYNNTEKVE